MSRRKKRALGRFGAHGSKPLLAYDLQRAHKQDKNDKRIGRKTLGDLDSPVEPMGPPLTLDDDGHYFEPKPVDDVIAENRAVQKKRKIRRVRVVDVERWQQSVEDKSFEFGLNVDPEIYRALIPPEILEQAGNPENVELLRLISHPREVKFLVVERDVPGKLNWDEGDFSIMGRNADYIASIQKLHELDERTTFMQEMHIRELPDSRRRSDGSMLEIAGYSDRGYDNNTRHAVLYKFKLFLSHKKFSKTLLVRAFDLQKVAQERYGQYAQYLDEMSKESRQYYGFPSASVFDYDLALPLERLRPR